MPDVITTGIGMFALVGTFLSVVWSLNNDLRWIAMAMITALLWGIFIYDKIKARKEERQ